MEFLVCLFSSLSVSQSATEIVTSTIYKETLGGHTVEKANELSTWIDRLV